MTTIVMQKKGDRLECTHEIWADLLSEFPEKTDLRVKITRARSLPQNGTYWGLLAWLVLNVEKLAKYPTKQHLSDMLQIELGFVNYIYLPTKDEILVVPQSKAFDKMSQRDFNTYFEKCLVFLNDYCGFDVLEAYLEFLKEC